MSSDQQLSLPNRRGLVRGGAVFGGLLGSGVLARSVRAADSINDSRLKTVLDRGKLIVGTGATNPPWHFEDDNGKLVGMDIDMAKEIAIGLLGVEEDPRANDDEFVRNYIEFVVEEPNARIPNLLSDKVDIVVQFMTNNNVRATQVEFTVPYYRESPTFLLPGDSEFSTIADLAAVGSELTIAVLQNVGVEEGTHAVIPGCTVDQYPSIADAISAMDSGRADAAAVDLSSGKWFSRTEPGRYKFTEGYNPNSYCSAVKPGDQIWLNFVNNVYREAMLGLNFKRYAASFQNWFGETPPAPTIGFPFEYR
jgi:polar amino acid transport system substrate-binding protein